MLSVDFELKLIPSAENYISHIDIHNICNIGSYYAWLTVYAVQEILDITMKTSMKNTEYKLIRREIFF
jgi:hypothetical protein